MREFQLRLTDDQLTELIDVFEFAEGVLTSEDKPYARQIKAKLEARLRFPKQQDRYVVVLTQKEKGLVDLFSAVFNRDFIVKPVVK